MPKAARLRSLLVLATFASVAPLAAGACGPSLNSLARDTFFVGYDCAKNQITVRGSGDGAYEATGCGKHALYHCREQNGGLACEEILPVDAGVAAASSSAAPSASGAAASSSAAPPTSESVGAPSASSSAASSAHP
jgi:hypothetical protein